MVSMLNLDIYETRECSRVSYILSVEILIKSNIIIFYLWNSNAYIK